MIAIKKEKSALFSLWPNITVIHRHPYLLFLSLALLINVRIAGAQIHSSLTIDSASKSSSSECSSLALSTCRDIQPITCGTFPRSSSTSSFTQRQIAGFKCEDLNFCDDILGFEAILNLHRQLDDDANGDIDISESKEFLRDELKYEHGANDRQRAFHGNDKHISVAELWHAWKISAVHNWTVEEVAQWLVDFVELPQYKERFFLNSINGMALPRLAVNQQLASTILGITNVIHRQKLALKATDVVLFGVPKPATLIKDLVMIALVLFASFVGYFAIRQNRKAQDHIRKMNHDIEALSNAEKQLEMMQSELNRTKQEHQTAYREKEHLQEKLKEHEQILEKTGPGGDLRRISIQQDDQRIFELERRLGQAMEELRRFEIAQRNKQWVPPRQVKELLQMTYEIEIKNYNAKKLRAEAQLREAREECDKLRKKRSSVFGAFRVAHGSSIDIVDATILQARTIMTELTKETHERIQRWKALEQLCGVDITTNPGFTSLERSLDNYNNGAIPSSFMLSRNQSSSTLRDSDNDFSVASGSLVRRTSIPEEDAGLTMIVSSQGQIYDYKVGSSSCYDDNINSLRSTVPHGQNIEMLHRLNGTGSDGVERHFESVTSVSSTDFSNVINKNNNCSFESEDFPPSSSTSSSESNVMPNLSSELVSLYSPSLSSTIKEKKKRKLFGLVKRRNKTDKKHID